MARMNSVYHQVLTRLCQDARQDMANKGNNEIDWNVNVEVMFFVAMIGLKPVGVNKHFMMLLLHHRFSSYIDHQISSKALWDHLDTMYDMAALHESEIIPFPNEEVNYELPEDCYDLLKSTYGVSPQEPESESESTKNGSSAKTSKNIATAKSKQGNATVPFKTQFAAPAVNKPLKSQTTAKSDIKASASDSTPTVKPESGSSVKSNKIKHSSSPLPSKTVKTEPNVVSKESSPDISVSKKNREKGSSPAITKKQVKVESSSSSSSSKKPKSESASNVSKPVKEQTPDSVKKFKNDKDIGKKGKSVQPVDSTPVSKKSLKETVSGVKKKNEPENNPKKTNETSSVKHLKPDTKSSAQVGKGQDVDTPTPSAGSRKSSVKVKSNESSKKLKHPKPEETSKKGTPAPKRRRIT